MSLPVLPRVPFYLVRHGESESNRLRVMGGVFDAPLTDLGRAQAQALCEAAKGGLLPSPDIMVHSGLSRARDTGLTLNQSLGLPVREYAGLNERDFGLWAGQSIEGMDETIESDDVTPPQGESLPTFVRRVFASLCEVLTYGHRPILVAHGGVFDAILMGYGFQPIRVKNCQIYRFEPSDDPVFPWHACPYQQVDGVLVASDEHARLEPRDPSAYR